MMRVGSQSERNHEIYKCRQDGETYSAIAARYGLTASRVMEICNTYKRALKSSGSPGPDEKYMVTLNGNISTIRIKEVDRIGTSLKSDGVFWRNVGSPKATTATLSEQNVIFKSGSLKEAEKFVDDVLHAVEEEKQRHELAMAQILSGKL